MGPGAEAAIVHAQAVVRNHQWTLVPCTGCDSRTAPSTTQLCARPPPAASRGPLFGTITLDALVGDMAAHGFQGVRVIHAAAPDTFCVAAHQPGAGQVRVDSADGLVDIHIDLCTTGGASHATTALRRLRAVLRRQVGTL